MQNFSRQRGLWFLAPVVSAVLAVAGSVTSFFVAIAATIAFKFVVRGAVLAVYFATIVALYLGIEACLEVMASATPALPEPVRVASSWVLPSNTGTYFTCLGTILFLELAFKHKNFVAKILGGTA